MKYLDLLIFCLALSCSTFCYGSSGTEGASFLDIPVGARPAALGSAYSALAADAYAPVWNPAGLGFMDHTEVAGQHLSYVDSIHYEYLGLAHPITPHDSLGASIQYLGSGNIASTDNNGNSIGNFSSYFASFNMAYSRRLGDYAAVGLTGKWLDARIGDFSASAYAADLGAMLRPNAQWSFGATVTNIGSKLTFINAGDSLPLAGHLSAAFRPDSHWTVAAEAVEEVNGFTSGRGGVEWRPVDMVALRAGYKSDTVQGLSAMAGMTVGMGLTLWGSELSYAWLPLGDLGAAQYFSIVVRFGEGNDQQKNLIYYQPNRIHEVQRAYPYDDGSELDEIIKLITAPEKESVVEAPLITPEDLR
jgi:hypothetical protein